MPSLRTRKTSSWRGRALPLRGRELELARAVVARARLEEAAGRAVAAALGAVTVEALVLVEGGRSGERRIVLLEQAHGFVAQRSSLTGGVGALRVDALLELLPPAPQIAGKARLGNGLEVPGADGGDLRAVEEAVALDQGLPGRFVGLDQVLAPVARIELFFAPLGQSQEARVLRRPEHHLQGARELRLSARVVGQVRVALQRLLAEGVVQLGRFGVELAGEGREQRGRR